MGFQMNADQLTGLFNNDPGGGVGYRENPGTGFDPVVVDIFKVSVGRDYRMVSGIQD